MKLAQMAATLVAMTSVAWARGYQELAKSGSSLSGPATASRVSQQTPKPARPTPALQGWQDRATDCAEDFFQECVSPPPFRSKGHNAPQPTAAQLRYDKLHDSLVTDVQRDWILIASAPSFGDALQLGVTDQQSLARLNPATRDIVITLQDDKRLDARSWSPNTSDLTGMGIVFSTATRSDCPNGIMRVAVPADGSTEGSVFQGACRIRSTITEIKRNERNWSEQQDKKKYRGSECTEAFVVDQGGKTLLRHYDTKGNRYESYVVHMRVDPNGFGDFEYDLRIVDYFAKDSSFTVTKYWTLQRRYPDRNSFDWLWGSDVYIPIVDSQGRDLGLLMASCLDMEFTVHRQHATEADRHAAITYGLGNTKRLGEGR